MMPLTACFGHIHFLLMCIFSRNLKANFQSLQCRKLESSSAKRLRWARQFSLCFPYAQTEAAWNEMCVGQEPFLKLCLKMDSTQMTILTYIVIFLKIGVKRKSKTLTKIFATLGELLIS
ncbi:hypothetical protein DLJ88_03305 [Evtepia gabavorous]|uniref:Uncharacterized protein n=1 Tax=Evtepia gabavorous TaxID=2211183 RepID=A0A3E2B5U0_9FIRM|nr:hypothetical protein DV520_03300 [Evtepia gabavorous]TYK63584.1 hypothetical protein DLJ88_03305 [Evtepia gabavorous]